MRHILSTKSTMGVWRQRKEEEFEWEWVNGNICITVQVDTTRGDAAKITIKGWGRKELVAYVPFSQFVQMVNLGIEGMETDTKKEK